MTDDPRRRIPRTDTVLAGADFREAIERHGRARAKAAVVAAQARARSGLIAPDAVPEVALAALGRRTTTLRPLLNGTGVVVHTNIGRAPLSPNALDALVSAAGYTDIEYDVATGQRARRGRGTVEAMLAAVPMAGGALAVANGAAALLLATTTLAQGRDLLVSRGELVEIGDGFRLPDLIASTGVHLREVGTTNRTRFRDYADAVTENTGAVLKVHPSNFVVTGFTGTVGIAELTTLGLPVVADIGSGLLHPDPLLPGEPDVATTLADGADLVICSGDKLLGGPQAGLIFGEADLVEQLARHPIARAVRLDKLTHAALEATLRGPDTPTYTAIHADPAQLRRRTEALAATLTARGIKVEVVPSVARVGGGGAPNVELPSWALALPERLAGPLRSADPAVVARVENGQCLVDVRCVDDDDTDLLLDAITAATGA